jgi:hypothetical protein
LKWLKEKKGSVMKKVSVVLILTGILSVFCNIKSMQYAPKRIEYVTYGSTFEVKKPPYSKSYFDVYETKCIDEYTKLVNASCNRFKHQLLEICLKHINEFPENERDPLFIITLKIHLNAEEHTRSDNQPHAIATDLTLPALERELEEVIRPMCRKLYQTTHQYKRFFSIKDDSPLQVSLTLRIHKIIEEYAGKQMKVRDTPMQESVYEFP